MKNKGFSPQLKQLGKIIQTERKRRGLTQTELGALAGSSINFVSQVESGKSSSHIGKVFQLLHALGFELHLHKGANGLVLTEVPITQRSLRKK